MNPSQIADNRADLLTFIQTMFKARKGLDLVPAPHHAPLCEAIERVVIGDIKRLIINIPPRSGKTEVAVINAMAWMMGNFPDSEFIHASYSKRLATSNAYNVRAMMQHETYKEIFPHTQIKSDSSAKDEFRTEQGGIVYATGSEGTITGYGAGKMRDTFGGCFPSWQRVQTLSGDKEISSIKAGDYVFAFDVKNRVKTKRRVVRRWNNPENHIIRIKWSDGTHFDCTPDHEVLTEAGWVSAIHFANTLNLVKCKPSEPASLASADASVISNIDNALAMLWLVIPLSVRQMLGDTLPSLPKFNLTNNANADVVSGSDILGAIQALEYLDNLPSGELRAWSTLKQGECAVSDSVLHIVALSSIREIGKAIISGVSVEVPNFVPIGPFTYEVLSNQVSNVFASDNPIDGEADSEISIPITRRLKHSDGLCPSNLSKVRHLIKPTGIRDGFPVAVEYIGHIDTTYCLEVEEDNSFILSQSGAVVSNCIIIDDPHKAGEANSDTMRANVIDWFSTTMESRKNRPETPIIVIMQRLHEEDLSGWLLAGGNGEEWTHLNIPAETESGESFWPEQFPLEELKRKEQANAYVYAGQYMQRPAPIGGGIFKDDWWQYYREAPAFKWRAIYADTAMKTKEQNDFSVFQCWGVTENNKAYLIDMIRGKWEAPELLAQGRAFYNKHRQGQGSLRYMKVEDKASGTGLIQTLKREGVNVLPIQRNIDKVTRAMDTAPSIEAGHVYLPVNHPCLSDILREATQFPNGAHDDCLDPMMDAISDMIVSVQELPKIAFKLY